MRYILPFGYQKVNEFLEPDIADLRNYFKMSEKERKINLVHEYPHMLRDYLIEDGIEFEWPVDQFGDKEQDYQLINDFLYHGNAVYYSGEPEIVKNQWLIHFTKPNNAEDISLRGFTKGVGDMYRLGLTTWMPEHTKEKGGFNFSYLLSDFYKYSGDKYGKEAVIFRASGVRMWHIGDEEYQVIFFGRSAKDRIPITPSDDHDWSVSDKDDKVLYGNDDLRKVTEWVTRNFTQYKNRLLRVR